MSREQRMKELFLVELTLTDEQKTFLGFYMGIKPEGEGSTAIEKNVYEFLETATKVHPYPCLYRWGFAKPGIHKHPAWNQIASTNPKLLDVGCCMGTDLRMLIYLGIEKSRLTGVELLSEFIQLGYEFFRDGNDPAMQSMFLTADFLDPNFETSLVGGQLIAEHFDAIYTGSVIHLFDQAGIIRLLQNIKRCLRKGGVFFGRTTGLPTPGIIEYSSKQVYLHNADSLRDLLTNEFGSQAIVEEIPLYEYSHVTEVKRPGSTRRILLQFQVTHQ
jgi:SAM-dependent methyltransferase